MPNDFSSDKSSLNGDVDLSRTGSDKRTNAVMSLVGRLCNPGPILSGRNMRFRESDAEKHTEFR